ncbi:MULTISPECIES: carbon-nitrogen hydrolase family protein [Micromonospora]|uniref:N-carbamoylputrescine amidase n=1 Tax=Micromonospora yangpuensis TaxID=683228 RepID=A0A1C6UFL1_9ACTN|nr:carbon-nitrogen hydrolase family protein [Micromonospora yangpuensis]GGM05687.1 hypothetical protein GCM10012279_24300 [Micromonospora yangpuensis]SCL52741.1 N-carbamoylputrescine amidase [Micromonospora yangpuensis]
MTGQATMRVTVCELADAPADAPQWSELGERLRDEETDLLLLPEMPFSPWLAGEPAFALDRWRAAVAAHDAGVWRLSDLGVPAVVSSRPVERGGRRYNEAFLWTARDGYRALHVKSRLPAEEGYWEATWFAAGPEPAPTGVGYGPAVLAASICSELWHFERARTAAQAGVNLILTPRATSGGWTDNWLVAGRATAVSSGAFCLSSNRVVADGAPVPPGQPQFGGSSWIIDPEGTVLARTSRHEPLLTRAIDLAQATSARTTYPRNLVGPGTA